MIPPSTPAAVAASPLLELHSGIDLRRMYSTHAIAAVFPVTAGITFYGWRAAIAIALVISSTIAGVLIWRRLGARGSEMRLTYCTWTSILLALTLPAHLATLSSPNWSWTLLIAAGLFLAMMLWLFGGAGSSRLHPVLVVHLLLVVMFQSLLAPHHMLQRSRVVSGDVLDARSVVLGELANEPWMSRPPIAGVDAIRTQPPAEQLRAFTTGSAVPERGWLSLDELIRDRIPPLEDLIIGGQPGAIGTASAIGVIMGGLFLLYRGLIDFRIPLLIVLAAFVALLVLPIPVIITDAAPRFRWLAVRQPGIGWSWAITFVNYELMAGPLLFVAFFLATSAGVRPISRNARTVFALVVGILAAVMQLYVSVLFGAYLALLLASPLSPVLDRVSRSRAIV